MKLGPLMGDWLARSVFLNTALAIGICIGGCTDFYGCGSKLANSKWEDQLTIVVATDNSRVLKEKAVLKEQRLALEAKKARLLSDEKSSQCLDWSETYRIQDAFAEKRERLGEKQQAVLRSLIEFSPISELANRKLQELKAREAVLIRNERITEESLRVLSDCMQRISERERRLVSCQSKSLIDRKEALDRYKSQANESIASAEKAYRNLLVSMMERGLVPSDLPPILRKDLQVASSYQRGNLESALAASESLIAAIQSFPVDEEFIAAKNRRIQLLTRRSSDNSVRHEADKILPEATKAYIEGRYEDANKFLNSILYLVEQSEP